MMKDDLAVHVFHEDPEGLSKCGPRFSRGSVTTESERYVKTKDRSTVCNSEHKNASYLADTIQYSTFSLQNSNGDDTATHIALI